MEIIQQFGIQPIMLAAQAVNFLIILYVLKRFLYKPMLSVLKKRKDEIALGLRNAEEARILLEKTAEAEKKVLKLAQAQAKKMIDEAKDQALTLTRSNEEQIKKQTEQMIKEAKMQIAQEAMESETRIMQNVARISMQVLEKSLSGFMGDRSQQEVMEKALKDLHKKTN